MQCDLWNVKCGVKCGQFGVGSVECGVCRMQCEALQVKCVVQEYCVKCGV